MAKRKIKLTSTRHLCSICRLPARQNVNNLYYCNSHKEQGKLQNLVNKVLIQKG